MVKKKNKGEKPLNNEEEEKVLSRSEIREMKKKGKKGNKEPKVDDSDIQEPESLEAIAQKDEEEILKTYKKKKRKHRFILLTVSILCLAGAGAGTYYYLYDTKLQEEQTIESLYDLYDKVFTDEEKTEIIKGLSKKQYTHVTELYTGLPNSTEKMEFSEWQEKLDTLFGNQQAVLDAMKKLTTDEGYISADITDEDFTKVAELLKQPFNADYSAELALEVELLRNDFDFMQDVRSRVNAFYDESGALQEFTQEYFDKLNEDIPQLTNLEVKAELEETVATTYTDWSAREKERLAQKEKEAEEARIRAKEEAERAAEEERIRKEAEEEARREAEELERIKEEARREVEAELEKERLEQEKANQSSQESTPTNDVIGANKIGINGNYKSYVSLGRANINTIQSSIDAGNIAAGITKFNGSDNQTTYFGGHNPGIFAFMSELIYNGAVITVTDSSGNPHEYKMIEKVDTTIDGNEVLNSIGMKAIDVYNHGSNRESILIQFCNTDNDAMSFWYGEAI